MKKFLVIGSANADLLIHTQRMPKLGETITGSDFSINSGGKGLNQAVAIAKLGGEVTFLGAVGADANGELLLSEIRKYGISFAGIKSPDVLTGTAIVTVVNGDNFIILNQGANGLITPRLIEDRSCLIREADYIVLQLEIPMESVVRAAEIAKKHGKCVIINPAPYVAFPDQLYSLVDYLIPNESEVEQLTNIQVSNEDNCRAAINYLRAKGIKNVIITLGSRGCVYSENHDIYFCPAEKTNVVDTTSAGDSFIGALCSRIARGENLSDAIRYATKVASITVSRSGAAVSIPYESEIT